VLASLERFKTKRDDDMAHDERSTPRRQVLQALAGGAAASVAAPLASAGPQYAQPAPQTQNPVLAAAAPAAPAAAGFLGQPELELLASLAEAIVPGSREAGVAPFVDQLLALEPRERQQDFLAALGAIQAESLSRHGKPWLALSAAQQGQLLEAVSNLPASRARRYWQPGEPVLPADRSERQPPTIRDRFDTLKRAVASAYYSSEKGMKELGWTGQMVHAEYPGCTHGQGHGRR
jgi:hypothetical protein